MSGVGVSRTARGLASLLLAMLFAGTLSVFWLTVSAPSASAATVTEPVEIVDPTAQSSGDGWSWDPAGSAGTLTLEGVDIQVADMKDANAAIVVPDGATIHLKGESTIVSAAPSASSSDLLAAIYCEGDRTITGDDTASASIRGEGSLNAGIYCVGDSTESTKGISLNVIRKGSLAGNLILKGAPSLTIEGTDVAIQFVSQAEDFQSNHVVIGDPNIGAVEGGKLTYAERDFGTDFLGVWTYSTGDVSIGENFAVEGASQRVVIGTENSVLLVTDNGAAAAGIEGVKAIAADGIEYAAQEWLDGSHVGYYRFARDLPVGTYTLDFGAGYETAGTAVIEVIDLGPSLFTMNFHTVELAQADNVWAWMIQPSTGERVSVLEHVLYGAEIQIGAQPDNGYRFVKWEAVGAAPEWENGDAAKAEQMVTIVGQATMTPTVEAAAPADPGSGDPGKDSGKGSGKTGLAASGDSADGVVAIAAIAAGIGAAAAAGAAAKRRSRR